MRHLPILLLALLISCVGTWDWDPSTPARKKPEKVTETVVTATISSLVAFQLGLLKHEMSHAMMASLLGDKNLGAVKPYPHSENGKWTIGSTSLTKPFSSDEKEMWFYLAPSLADTVMFSSTDLLLSYNVVKKKNRLSRLSFFIVGMVGPYVDFSANYLGGTDWQKMRGIAEWLLDLSGATWMLIATWRLWYQGRRLVNEW